ncbi:MAG: amidohydrolase family protein, partial [Acidimicrobiia bacterium]
MYRTPSGEDVFIVDGHVHLWDASPANWKDKVNAEGWINCFYDYHRNLSPPELVWPLELYQRYGDERMAIDLFEKGHVDVGILQPTYLKDFYTDGFNTVDQQAFLVDKYPGRFILNGRFDPRDGKEGLAKFRDEVQHHNMKGIKLYTAEWKDDSKGWKLDDPGARPFFDACAELGAVNIHVHKGPTIWPLNKDAFDVADVDKVATEYRDAGLRFIVEHCGLPRLEDFCWMAVQEPNVYAGLAVVMPFMHAKPYYFAEVVAELLW